MAGISSLKIILQWNFLFWNIIPTKLPKKEILMADINIPNFILEQKFPFLVIMIAYISRPLYLRNMNVDIDLNLT